MPLSDTLTPFSFFIKQAQITSPPTIRVVEYSLWRKKILKGEYED